MRLKKLREVSIFWKISAIFEIVLILTILGICAFATSRFSKILYTKATSLGDVRVEKLADFSANKYNRIYGLSNYIHSGEISDVMAKMKQNPDEMYSFDKIQSMNVFFAGVSSADREISDIVILSVAGGVFSYSETGYSEVSPSYDFWGNETISKFVASDKMIAAYHMDPSVYTIKQRGPVVAFLGKIYDASRYPKKELLGIFMMNIPTETFYEAMGFHEENVKGNLYLTNSEGEILFSTDELAYAGDTEYDEQFQKKIAGETGLYCAEKNVSTSEMKAYYLLTKQEIYEDLTSVKYLMASVIILAIGLITVIEWAVIYVYRKRVQRLLKFMNEVEEGQLDVRVPVDSEDEIGVLSKSFNEMCEKLDLYIDRAYRAALAQKNAELNALQMQIDPHFLYNTLESIKANAMEQGDETTAEMLLLLADLFRWSTRTKDKIVLLEEELDYINTYLKLQSYRYKDKLDISFQIEPECLDLAVPKLVLQPVVENVIRHAFFGKKNSGLVGVTAKVKEEKRLEITVYDNGNGIPPEKLEQICQSISAQEPEKERAEEGTNIGIRNVDQRIKLLFGEEYGLEISSIYNMGTAVKLTFPAMQIEEMSQLV
ncbi:MAG: histidine kinase [Eubacteriales bacterium]|nr:histidine kinase [Eubacteriales bacterium]